MATAEEFERTATALAQTVEGDVDLTAIELQRTDRGLRVNVITREPGRLIGRRGATADAIRRALQDALEAPDVQFSIQEFEERPPLRWPPFDDGGPLDPPSGTREPRDRPPGTPPTGASLEEPTRPTP